MVRARVVVALRVCTVTVMAVTVCPWPSYDIHVAWRGALIAGGRALSAPAAVGELRSYVVEMC